MFCYVQHPLGVVYSEVPIIIKRQSSPVNVWIDYPIKLVYTDSNGMW